MPKGVKDATEEGRDTQSMRGTQAVTAGLQDGDGVHKPRNTCGFQELEERSANSKKGNVDFSHKAARNSTLPTRKQFFQSSGKECVPMDTLI